ncbi:MAG: CocE/NonD family hydrolase [Gammaproteobacteria bacterium]|nr:CocE/NonD family hydrolase [Gammaproteobacteria bacterium]
MQPPVRERVRFAMLLAVLGTATGLLPEISSAEDSLSQPEYGVVFEEDVAIAVRDGTVLRADVYRPSGAAENSGAARFPVLLSLSAYQKDLDRILPHVAPFTHVERPEPDWWVPRGYVLVFVDTRGTGKSPGKADIWSMQEARDLYDAIEWAAGQEWSTGKVGLSGVSYYAITQWNVASLQPPSLTTIVPWEGWADLYRDSVFHGGILNQAFYGRWWNDVVGKQLLENTRANNSAAFDENLMWNFMTHHTDSPWWDEVKSRAQFDRITVPLYSSGNWGGWNHHLRGNIEAFVRSASEHKKLQVHIGGHTDAFYSDEGKTEMLRWYDYWLKGRDTGIMDEPPVKLCVRESLDKCSWRFENEWPLERTQYTKYYLTSESANAVGDALHDLRLAQDPPAKDGAITYSAGPEAYSRALRRQPTVTFVTEALAEDTEITGHINLKLWVSSETDDMDVFAYLRDMAPDGSVDTVTRGILKVSHRKLDPALSTPYRPYHAHDEEQKLSPGEIVPIEVEIWATSMVFRKGHRIRLDVQSHDGEHYFAAYNLRNNSIYTGGDRASYVLLPVVPAKP